MGLVIVAAAIGIAIFVGAVWAVRMIASGPPPEPDPDDVHEVEVGYRCTVCGMRLMVTHAQDVAPEAPRHCREDMEPV